MSTTLADYDFIAPAQWQVQYLPDHILLTQSPEALACRIQVLSLQPSSWELDQDAKGVFATNHGGTSWKDRLYLLTRDRGGEFEVCYEKQDR